MGKEVEDILFTEWKEREKQDRLTQIERRTTIEPNQGTISGASDQEPISLEVLRSSYAGSYGTDDNLNDGTISRTRSKDKAKDKQLRKVE